MRIPAGVVETLRAAGCVFAEEEAQQLVAAVADRRGCLDDLVGRRVAGEPLELVVGHALLAGVRIGVRPGVFVPRQRSAALVEQAVELAGAVDTRLPVVVDLGCGTGGLLLALLRHVRCAGYAIDCSLDAVRCARENFEGTDVLVRVGSGLDVLPADLDGRVDVILANLPYVPTSAIGLLPREARLHEPWSTLDGGPDGLRPLAGALATAGSWLQPRGHYLAELHPSQVADALRLARSHGLVGSGSVDDDTDTAVLDLVPTG